MNNYDSSRSSQFKIDPVFILKYKIELQKNSSC